MLFVSPAVAIYEVWIFASPDFRQPVQSCGLFHEEQGAVHAASLLRDYLHIGVWNDNIADNADGLEDVLDLRVLPEHLHAAGIDPARVLVTAVRRVPGQSDNAIAADWRTDCGSTGCRGPHVVTAGDRRGAHR